MEPVNVMPTIIKQVKTNSNQLKLVMNLPVRFSSEGKDFDVYPIPEQELLMPVERIITHRIPHSVYCSSLDEIIDFFKQQEHGDLMSMGEVAMYFDVSIKTIQRWSKAGLLKRYFITRAFCVYKRKELPQATHTFLEQ